MKLSGLFKVSMVASALALVGCGGDINITPTTIDNSIDNSTTTTGGGTTENPCAKYTVDGAEFQGEVSGANCLYKQSFASNAKEIESGLLIPELKDGVHIFEGSLFIGKDVDTSNGGVIDPDGPTLTIEAGATIAFTKPDRLLAIEAISMHKQYEEKLSLLRTSLGNKKQIPLDFLDLIYMFERIAQSWADVADLVQPIYNK